MHRDALGHARYLVAEHKRIVMTLPLESVGPAAREAAIASLQSYWVIGCRAPRRAREQHGKDASYDPCVPPDAVAFAQSTEEVSDIVKLCARNKVPIIPFGAGTGFEGNLVALRGGCVSICRERTEF